MLKMTGRCFIQSVTTNKSDLTTVTRVIALCYQIVMNESNKRASMIALL
jgi:hypothetical protein